MLELQSTFRRIAFFAYAGMVPAIPLGILWGKPGLSLGLFVSLMWLTYIRASTDYRIWKILGLRKVLDAQQPVLFNLAKEHCRRLELPIPQLAVMPSRNLTLGIYGFSEKHTVLFVSSSLLEYFSREELSASLSWALSHLWHRQVPCETWLAGFLLSLGQRDASNIWSVLRRALVLPLGFVPIQILACRGLKQQITRKAERLSGLPWDLNQALRKMWVSVQKEPLNVPLGVTHLFAVAPPPRDPLSRVLFQTGMALNLSPSSV